jgi:hypothetical protein
MAGRSDLHVSRINRTDAKTSFRDKLVNAKEAVMAYLSTPAYATVSA